MAAGRSEDRRNVVSRSFALSPSVMEEVRAFVEQHLQPLQEGSPEAGNIAAAVAQAAADHGHGPIHLAVRLFADHIEVTVGMGSPPGVSFREWLAETLRREGLSQEAAARRIGVSLKTVNRWLRGHSEPRMRELRRVREVFGQPPIS